MSITTYCLRRGAASLYQSGAGDDAARNFLQHKAYSDTLNKHYNQNNTITDMVSLITEQVVVLDHDLSDLSSPAMFRYVSLHVRQVRADIPVIVENRQISSWRSQWKMR